MDKCILNPSLITSIHRDDDGNLVVALRAPDAPELTDEERRLAPSEARQLAAQRLAEAKSRGALFLFDALARILGQERKM